MKGYKWVVGACLLALSQVSFGGSLSFAGMSLENTWFKAYEQYGYNEAFEDQFSKALGYTYKNKIYHMGAGTVICNSKESAKELYEASKISGASRVFGAGSNAFPGCFKVHFRKVVAYKYKAALDGPYTQYKFIMTKQPSWRPRFFDNNVGEFAIFSGWTISDFEVDKLPWQEFIDKDTKRFQNKKDHIRNTNNMPDKDGKYPLL